MSVVLKIAGTDITDSPYSFDVVDVRKPLMAEPRGEVTEYGSLDGVYAGGGALGGLTFEVVLATMAPTSAALEARLDALRRLLDPRSNQTFECGLWPDRYWKARVTGALEMEPLGVNGCELTLRFLAPDPLAYGATEISRTFAIDSEDKMIAVAQADLANGTAPARPVITVTCATNETLFWFYNQTTQQQLQYGFYAYAGYQVQFDSEQYLIRYSADSGVTWTTRMQGKTGTFLTLAPGVANNIRVEHLGGTSVNITFRERYR